MAAGLPDIWPEDDEPRLPSVLETLWRLLERGVCEAGHGFHTPAFATRRRSGGASLRTVVLRGIEREARVLWFHSDRRSRKVKEIESDPDIAFLFFDPAEETQIRAEGRASLHFEDGHAEAAWAATPLLTRRGYLQEGAPSQPWSWPASGLPPALAEREPTAEESEAGRRNFAVVRCRVERLEWLYLSPEGNRAARFSWDEAGQLAATWALP